MTSNLQSSYFSRAGKASLSKFKILLDRDKILNGERVTPYMPKTKSQQYLAEGELQKIISSELQNLKPFKPQAKPSHLSPAFLAPGRSEKRLSQDLPDMGRYNINYSLVEKAPISYSIPKPAKDAEIPKQPDSFLSSNLHQFPEKSYKGIPFQCQTARKDITIGQPSPHEERFKVQNLITPSCSKYSSVGMFDIGKYAERKEFFEKKEFCPDYEPNKEFVLPKITKNIQFKTMTDRKNSPQEKEWPKVFDVNMTSQEKKSFIKDLGVRTDKKSKVSRAFSPSKLLNLEEG